MAIKDLITLIRPQQWYKNLLIFLAIIFSGKILYVDSVLLVLYGFLLLILISSANYIFNDLFDSKYDRLNPEKKDRPLASNKVSRLVAILLFLSLLSVALILSYMLSLTFFLLVIAIFSISTLYTLFFKNIVFLDIILVSINFILRAIAGAVIINVYISHWLVLGIFFFALFLVTGKRYGEIIALNKGSAKHRSVLKYYSKDICLSLFNIFMTILIIIYSLFSFSSVNPNLIWSTPLFVYIILRYYYLILNNSVISRSPEKFVKDAPLLISSILFLLVNLAIILM